MLDLVGWGVSGSIRSRHHESSHRNSQLRHLLEELLRLGSWDSGLRLEVVRRVQGFRLSESLGFASGFPAFQASIDYPKPQP